MSDGFALEEECAEVRAGEDFDRARLAAYLAEKLEGARQPMEVRQFVGGHSNLTYLLSFRDRQWVMRRPPPGPLPRGGHDMGREYRVLSRLWQVFPSAPRGILYCDDPGVIGAPFFIMEHRQGVVIRKREPLPDWIADSSETCRKISEGFIDTLCRLHSVDYEEIGLGNLGKPEGYFARQVRGWTERWERAKTREVTLMTRLAAWFAANEPAPQPPCLLHNDFYLHNMMLDPRDPGRVVAVLDWEMSTLGDPRTDLAIALAYWRDRDDPEELWELSEDPCHTLRPGFLGRQQLAERYAQQTGRSLSELDFFLAWAYWKTATVVEQLYAGFARGHRRDPRYASMAGDAPVLATAAARIAARCGFKT